MKATQNFHHQSHDCMDLHTGENLVLRPLFYDETIQKQYDKDGFVNMDFLTAFELETLRSLYAELKKHERKEKKNMPTDFELSFFFNDPSYRKRVFNTLSAFFQPLVDRHLDNYKPIIINIFDKPPGGIGEVPIHMDWSFVDETKYSSVSVWVPLINVTRENGTIELVKGSHKKQQYRGTFIPYSFDGHWDKLKTKYLEPQNLNAGQICILDNSIIHWTADNYSDKTRTTIQIIMAPAEAPVNLYYKDPNANQDRIEIFSVDSDFYTDFYIYDKPEASRSLGFVDYKIPQWTEEDMVEIIAASNPKIKDYYNGRDAVDVHAKARVFGEKVKI